MMATQMRSRRKQEGGFALLVVFLLAAAVAFTLYQELPRAAFESARDKEQLLIDRGNQYKRAIEVYYAVNKRFPAELKDLENTNEKRYLRHRYKDPLTGKDEWRLIHTNGTALTDSLVQKPPAQNAANGTPGNGTLVGGGPLGSNNLNTAPAAADASAPNGIDPATGAPIQTVNAAALRRPSDRGFNPGGPAPTTLPGVNPFGGTANGANPSNYDPSDPRTWPAITLTPPTATNGQQTPGVQQPGQGSPTQIAVGNNPPTSTFDPRNPAGASNPQQPPVNNADPSQAAGNTGFNQLLNQQPVPPVSQPGVTQAQPPFPGQQQLPTPPQFPVQPQAPSQAQSGTPPQVGGNGATNPATQFINNTLFSGTQTGITPGAANGTAGPGIAGVASQFKGPSIKSYQKRTKYQEWEFVFDPAAKNPVANATNPTGTNTGNPNQPGQTQGQPGMTNPFGLPSGQNAPASGPSLTGPAATNP
jgi:hypothetical protein